MTKPYGAGYEMHIILSMYSLAELQRAATLDRGEHGELKIHSEELGLRVWLKDDLATVEKRSRRRWHVECTYTYTH